MRRFLSLARADRNSMGHSAVQSGFRKPRRTRRPLKARWRPSLLRRDTDQRHDEEIDAPVTVKLCEFRRDATPLARELGDLEEILRSRIGSP